MDTTSLNTERLIECREKLGITKQEAAKRIKMSQPAYLRYKSGQRIPSIHVIYVMANVLGTSVEYLLCQTDDPKPTQYVIESQAEPELFETINLYIHSDEAEKKRLIAYIKEFSFR